MIKIDGSPGGGQLLRTALSLSAILREPFEISSIRGAREQGGVGLKAQHLACASAMQQICNAKMQGAKLGSTSLIFEPSAQAAGGNYAFDIGTAGSATLLAQCLLPALLFSKSECKLSITGGTHVSWSPSAHFLQKVFLPQISKMGARAEMDLERWGFFPEGGGKIAFKTTPWKTLEAIQIPKRGKLISLSGISAVANLPLDIAKRQKTAMLKLIASSGNAGENEAKISIEQANAVGRGTFAFLLAEYENACAGFGALGEKAKPAEKVGEECAQKFLEFHESAATVDEHLADQLMLYAALARGKTSFECKITPHIRANASVLLQFLQARGFEIAISGKEKEIAGVEITGAGFENR